MFDGAIEVQDAVGSRNQRLMANAVTASIDKPALQGFLDPSEKNQHELREELNRSIRGLDAVRIMNGHAHDVKNTSF